MNPLTIDKSKTALVVIDLQKGIAGRQVAPYTSDVVIKNAAAIADAFRYHQIFAEDAMAAMSVEEHAFTTTKTFPRIGLVRKTEDIVNAL